MYDRILVPVDGSPFAEEVIPYSRGLGRATGAKLIVLAVAEQGCEFAAVQYVSGLARRLDAEGKVALAHMDPASTILEELNRHPRTLATMTTHGHTGLLEIILGSVTLSVVRDAPRAVLLYRPRGGAGAVHTVGNVEIASVVAPIDGSDFSEQMLPHAAELAKSLKANLELVQVLTEGVTRPPEVPPGDVLECSYVHSQAERLGMAHGIDVHWEVLHGDAADAICRYVNGRDDLILAMSSHGRAGLRETILGSVTHECVRRAGVPILVYHPGRQCSRRA